MPTVTESDLKELKDLITSGFSRLDAEITGLKISQERLSGQITSLDEKLTGKINVLDEKITGLGKRLEFQEFINRSILGGLIIIVLGGVAKYFGIMPNP
jgi:chromosome segregation ATPase